MKVANLGVIRSMLLPEGWLASRQIFAQAGNSYLLRYTPPGLSQVRLCFFYRGKLTEVDSGRALRRILQQKLHRLEPAEIEELSEILRDQSSPELFQLEEAMTIDLNSRAVLMSHGRFVEFNFKAYSIFIDSGEDGCAVQEIYFTAPPQMWDRYLPPVLNSLAAIEWQ